MRKTRAVFGMIVGTMIWGCIPPTGSDDPADTAGPGPIISPRAGTSLLVGDTIRIVWTNAIKNAVVAYNYNDASEAAYMDTLWHAFTESEILSIDDTSARVRTALGLSARSESFLLRITDPASGAFSESGQLPLDHIVLLKPAGGESFAIGQAVPIRFKRNRFMKRVYLSFVTGLDGGIPLELTSPDINFFLVGTDTVGSVFDTTWVIGSETYGPGVSPRYPSDSCYVYAYSYYLGTDFDGDPSGQLSDRNAMPFRIVGQ